MADTTTAPLTIHPTREGAFLRPVGGWVDEIVKHIALTVYREGLCSRLDEYGELLHNELTRTRPTEVNEDSDAEIERLSEADRAAELRASLRERIGDLPPVVLGSEMLDHVAEDLGWAVVELLRREGQNA